MATIGSRRLASEIYDIYNSVDQYEDYPYANIPKEWKVFGSDNATRAVFLHKATDVVYKISEHSPRAQYDYGNASEINNYRRLKWMEKQGKLPPNVRIPLTSCFMFLPDSVIAMQRIKGRRGNGALWLRKELFQLGFADMHNDNYIVCKEKKIWPIDMGSPRDGSDPVDKRLIDGSWWFA